jgi:hypothetical protein
MVSGAIALTGTMVANSAFAAHGDNNHGGGHSGSFASGGHVPSGMAHSGPHGGGFGGHHFHGARGFPFFFNGRDDWSDDYSYDQPNTCWQYERVPTRNGWQWQEVYVCG